jgi:hypothetical protein
MITRGEITHQYFPAPVVPITRNGIVKVATVDHITQTWAIARPGSSPNPNGAPFYVNGYPVNSLELGGVMPLTPIRPRIEMDPSNPKTWQREYRFTR